MTLTELRYITAVAKERHFGRAAAACFVSQPTLSVAVKKLEEELNVTIFERHQHDIYVTETGEKIIEQARLVLEQADVIKHIAKQSGDELSGELRLGVIYTIGPYLIPKLIPIIHELAPELTLIIEEDYTEQLAEKLKQGEIDMVIASTPFEYPAVDSELLYREPFVSVLPKAHKLAKKKSVELHELMDDVLLLLRSGNCFRDQVMNACSKCQGIELDENKIQKTLESSSIETIRQMVAAGVGVTVLPVTAVYNHTEMSDLLEYRPFNKPAPEREVIVAWRSSFPRKTIVEMLKEAISKSKLEHIEKV